jgi:hypothetical protein
MTRRLVTVLLMLAGAVCAQHSVDPRNTYHRVIAVVPMIGSGTAADPRRPEYAPAPGSAAPNGIIGFTQVPTDDGKFAIVEFVARTRKALLPILSDTTITTYEKGTLAGTAIESALQSFKKGFSLVQFEVVMP